MGDYQNSVIPPDMTVGFIGAGRMAQAMARGFISTGAVKVDNITASDPDPRALGYLEGPYRVTLGARQPLPGVPEPHDMGVKTTLSNAEVVANSQLIVIAVKPNVVAPILQEVSAIVSIDKLVVSIAAGVTIRKIEQLLQSGSRVIRVMPNMPALVQAAASVLAPGTCARTQDTGLVLRLLRCIGTCEAGSESQLDAVTGLSGGGPAYAFTAIEAMSDGGVKMGLPRDLAIKLAAQTLLGAAKMVLETGKHPGMLKDEICSPGGTTIAAMHKLEKAGFRGALIDAVEAATLRARELGSMD